MTSRVDPDLELELAATARAGFDVDGLIAHLSAAIRGFTEQSRPRDAAIACAQLGGVYSYGLFNLTAGRAWFARATRLVADEPPCVEQGWVALAAMGCDVDDPDELLARAELALERARTFGDLDLEGKALADGGLALVRAGRVAEGMAMLDEAMALVCGPSDDVETACRSVCSFFTACYDSADFARADSWVALLRQRGVLGGPTMPQAFISSHCDSVQASLLRELGRWGEAEAVLTGAIDAFETAVGAPSWHPAIVLADLRVCQGRLIDAEMLLLGKEAALEALLPAARLHAARGDHLLARSTAERGLRSIGSDRLRAAELLAVLVDVELASGDVDAASRASAQLDERVHDIEVASLQARAAAVRARVLGARGEGPAGIDELEHVLAAPDVMALPWLRVTLLLELAQLHRAEGDQRSAGIAVDQAAALLSTLDVVVPSRHRALLDERAAHARPQAGASQSTASLRRDGRWWEVDHDGTRVRLTNTKGLRYVADLVGHPGAERHVLDLVDRVEGVAAGAVPIDRRALGDAGPMSDPEARTAYRRRVEELRAEIDEALATQQLERAEALQAGLDELVAELSRAFGLGGAGRRAASAAERARLNVTRAIRSATAKLASALPDAGDVLDRRIRTGLYCAYEPVGGEVDWTVVSRSFSPD